MDFLLCPIYGSYLCFTKLLFLIYLTGGLAVQVRSPVFFINYEKEYKKQYKKITKRSDRILKLMSSPLYKIIENLTHNKTLAVSQDAYVDDHNVFHIVLEYDFPIGKIK